MNTYYIDSGASQHLIPTQMDLHAYWEFLKPVEIAAANGGVVYAYGSGMLRVSSSAEGLVTALQDMYYALGIHACLVSFSKLLHQGWTVHCSKTNMELRTKEGLLFTNVEMANNMYPIRHNIAHLQPVMAAWTVEGVEAESALDELTEHLGRVAMVAMVKGPDSKRASLLTWHRQLGHLSFKTMVTLAKGGVSGMEISDLPTKIPGLNACTTCAVAKAVHLLHKEGWSRATEYLKRVHIDIAGLMPVKSAGGREYLYVVVDNCTRTVYAKPLQLKSEAIEAFKAFKVAAENESGKKIQEVMMDNTQELCMGEMQDLCTQEGIKLHTSVPYHPALNRVAKCTIRVLTNAVWAMLQDSGLPGSLWAEAFITAAYVHNRTPTKVLKGLTPFEVCYGAEPDLAHLQAFRALCSIVKPLVKLQKLDDWARMCCFVGYKYGGGGYRVWDPKGKVMVESRDVVFFEDSLPPPTLAEVKATELEPNTNDDKPLTTPLMPSVLTCNTTLPLAPPVAHAPPNITTQPCEKDVTLIPGYPERLMQSGLTQGGGNSFLAQVAFSASLPGGIQLLSLLDPCRCTRPWLPLMQMGERMPWTGRWRISTHTMYMRWSCVYLACTPFVLGGFFTESSRTVFSKRTRPGWSHKEITSFPAWTMANPSCP